MFENLYRVLNISVQGTWVYDNRKRTRGYGLLYKSPSRRALQEYLLGCLHGYQNVDRTMHTRHYIRGHSRGQELSRYDTQGDTSGITMRRETPPEVTRVVVPELEPEVPDIEEIGSKIVLAVSSGFVVKPKRSKNLFCKFYASESTALRGLRSIKPVCGRRNLKGVSRIRCCINCVTAWWRVKGLTPETAPPNDKLLSGKLRF